MQIVIDIDDDLYVRLFDNGGNNVMDMRRACVAIRKGTPLDNLRAEIERLHYHPKLDFIKNDEVVDMVLDIIDKYKAESDHKCHTCKHYMRGEYDGSCDSYICKGYSDWESEDEE